MSFMPKYVCPICYTEYDEKKEICSCGFEGIEFYDYNNPQYYTEQKQKNLFKIYKFTKKVACKEIDYPKSKLSIIDTQGLFIEEVLEKRGLAYINAPDAILGSGALAFNSYVVSLYADVKGIKAFALDESSVKMLFLGEHFKSLTDKCLISFSALRYIWVDPNNTRFFADNNVLFNKDQTILFCYARMRPEEEYTVPQSVEVIKKYAFYFTKHLKKLYIHKGTVIEDKALKFHDDKKPEIIFID